MEPTSLPATCRLFIGLLPDAPVREAVLAWRARWRWPRGTALSAPAHLHLTLYFLGDTDATRLPRLRSTLSRVAVEPFTLRLGLPQAWHSGLVVLRPQPCEALETLRRRVGQAVQAAGLDVGAGPWKPHLTLARKAADAQPPGEALDIAWAVGGFALVWSRLQPQVPVARYETLATWGTLAGPAHARNPAGRGTG